ncbi:MAG: S46 family peptidase [Phycisphaerae bacterium]
MKRTRRLTMAMLTMLSFASLPGTARGDEGMWLINRPPMEQLTNDYGFTPDEKWLEHVQKSCVRMGRGGSGSLVSRHGLVMTNHHVGRGQLAKLSTPDWDILKDGFLARQLNEELKCPDLEVNILWEIEDVTSKIEAATSGLSPADAVEKRNEVIATLTKESQEATGLFSEVVTLYHGARFHLYKYKRYSDVRLVMAPESAIGAFGGDTDNFEYPRYCLDMCFFRIYENKQPLNAEHYFEWSGKGASKDELVFVAGHPARTQRLYTIDHVKFLRDVDYPSALRRIWRREVQLLNFSARNAENARIAASSLLSHQNSRKAYTGMLGGLLDPAIFNAKQRAETKLREAVMKNSSYASKWGDAWEKISQAQKRYMEFHELDRVLRGRRGAFRGRLPGTAQALVRYAEELQKPNGERLPQYRESSLESTKIQLLSPAPIYPVLEVDQLASGLRLMAETLGADHPVVKTALKDMSPVDRARMLVEGTRVGDIEFRKQLMAGGIAMISATNDPMIRFAAALEPEITALRDRFEAEVESVQTEAYAQVAAAKFAIEGESSYPDATFSLRLSYGTVKGYNDGDQSVKPFTDFAGLYERFESRGGVPPFHLPKRWEERRSSIDLTTPFNFVSTNDIIGGNSGSPVFNKNAEIVGLVFDGNIHTLVWNSAYTDRKARAVSVDSRGIVESLRKVYGANELVSELLGN